jgi:branched-chain amino acid aminotransferase
VNGKEDVEMDKKNIDWANLGFGYVQTDKRFVSNFKNGAWDEGVITEDANIVLNECAGVLQYAQTVFEGLKAYTTEDGRIVCFRPDLNASRLVDSAKRLEMPVFPEDRFIDAVVKTVKANIDYVPPYGSGATLYIRPYMFGTNSVIGVKPAEEYQFRIFCTPVGPYFKGGAKPITIKVSDFDRAAPHGTGHIKAGLNYAMSLHAIVTAHAEGFDENMYLDAATRTKVEETGGANFLFVTKDGKIVTP